MKTKGISDQARILHSALLQRGVHAEIEKWDGHKHTDLSIDEAGLYVEINGNQHYTDATTIRRDLARDYYSDEEGYDTFHIPNFIIDEQINAVADALAEVAKQRIK